MPPFPAPGTQMGALCASAAAGPTATKKSSAAALAILRMETLLARLVVLLTVEPRAQRGELAQIVLLLRSQVSELTLELRHLQLPQLLELLHLLDADHVADLDRLHVPNRAVAERLELRECRFFTRKLRTLQPRRLKRALDSTERIFATLCVRARIVCRNGVAGVHLRELAAQISIGITNALSDLGDLRERIQVAANLSPDAVRNVLEILHFVGE